MSDDHDYDDYYESPQRGGSPEWCHILETIRLRMAADSELIARMAEIQCRYNGEYVMPLLSDHPDLNIPPISPALITDAIENLGNRAASVFPGFEVPQLRNQAKGTGSRAWADIRRSTLEATWANSRGKLVLRRACKQLAGYDSTCFVIAPSYHPRDARQDGVHIKVRSPLSAYPDTRENDDFATPGSVGFVFERSASWLRATYPKVCGPQGPIAHDDERPWRVLEWVDEYNTILGLMGPVDHKSQWDPQEFPAGRVELMSFENRLPTGPPVVMPARVSLDKLGTRLSHITGITDLMSQLMVLEMLSTEDQIFPDRYIVSTQARTAKIVSHGGEWRAGRTGDINVLKDVAQIGALTTPPPPQSGQMIDTLERIARQHSKDVPQFRGESYGSLRTGRGIDSLMGASVDPVIQELHETLECALPEVNAKVLETWKHHWAGRTFSLYSGNATSLREFTLDCDVHIETSKNVVSYAIPGADIQAVTVQLGQLLATKGMSLRTFRIRHPWIDDPSLEAELTDAEAMEEAILQGFLQGLASQQIPLMFAAKVLKYRKTEPSLIDALEKADKEVAEEQAAMAEQAPDPTDPNAQPGLAGGPETLTPPGMPPLPEGVPPEMAALMAGGQGGMPVEPDPAIGPTEDQAGLKRLINALTGGQSMVQGADV